MSLKAELETWAAALQAYDDEDFERALELFAQIADASKILCNMGLIYATMGEHEAAVERFQEATKLDQYLAVAYFQCGVSNFLLGNYDLAYKDFDEALLYLRGNQVINYEQLGLRFRLYSAEVLFNKGLSLIYMGQVQQGLADMEEARKEKATEEHNVIDDAIADRGEGYTVFSIPVGVLYRPSEMKLKNSLTKDYLGKAILVATSDPADNGTDFSGAARLKQGISPSGIYLDRTGLQNKDTSFPSLPRSATLATSSPTWKIEGPKSAGVERSNTYLFDRRENSNTSDAKSASPLEPTAPRTVGLSRSKTQITPARASPNATPGGVGGQSRSLRRISTIGISPPILPPKDSPITEFYSEYAASRGNSPIKPGRSAPASAGVDRVWPRNNVSLSRSTSSSAQSAPGHVGGGSAVRKLTRKGTASGRYRDPQNEEGSGSDNHDGGYYDLTLIRVKIHHQDDVRGMTMTTATTFGEFMAKLCSKFQTQAGKLDIKFIDEDNAKITLRDESDFEMAIETARTQAKGRPEGKLELYCREL